MPYIPFPREWRLSTATSFGIATSELALHAWTRRQRAGRAVAIFGGQTGFVSGDAARYVHSRALRPHRDKTYEGSSCTPAPDDLPLIYACATNLRVLEATSYDGSDERARVPSDAPLRLRWNASEPVDFVAAATGGQSEGAPPSGGWQWRVCDALTGTVLASGIARDPVSTSPDEWEAVVPPLGTNCTLAWVNASGVAKPYEWPSDFKARANASDAQIAALTWTHRITGTVYRFSPKHQVGARPYDTSDPQQAALLEQEAELQASGELQLFPEWADKLIAFNPDGTQTNAGGEYSCLKLQPTPAWCGDRNVHPSATAGIALWHDPNEPNAAGNVARVPVPLIVEPRLRDVGDFLHDKNGSFWLTGMAATRNGRATALLRVDENWHVLEAAYGVPELPPAKERAHSRVLLHAEAGRFIFRSRGVLCVLTQAGVLRLKRGLGGARLVQDNRAGGHAGAHLVRLDGTTLNARICDPDQARSDAFARSSAPTGAGHVAFDVVPYPGLVCAKSYAGALCAKETFWTIVENTGKEAKLQPPLSRREEKDDADSDEEGASTSADEKKSVFDDDQQGLARFVAGGTNVLAWWPTKRFDMGRVVPWSKGVYLFGFKGDMAAPDFGAPRAGRWTGDGDGLLELGLHLPYIVLNGKCEPTPDGKSETLRIVGKKMNGARELPGFYAAEGTYGARPRVDANGVQRGGGVGAGAGPNTVDFNWDESLNAFTLSRADCEAAGFAGNAFPPYAVWSAPAAAWLASGAPPNVRDGVVDPDDNTPYLVYDGNGDPLRYNLGQSVTLPQNPRVWCGLRFTASTCQGVMRYTLPPTPGCGAMDVAMVVDTTGSMGTAMASVKRELATIVADIERVSNGDYRLALVTFKDDVTVNVPFSPSNGEDVRRALDTLQATGGDGEPEASDEALNTVVRSLGAQGRTQTGDFAPTPAHDWRAGARKIAILVTDARPGGFHDDFQAGRDDAHARDIANAARARDILVSAVYTPTGNPAEATVVRVMNDYADTTGGYYLRTGANGRGTGAAIADIINGCGGGAGTYTPVEYCTDDLIVPVPCCGSAACVITGDPNARVGVLRVEAQGPINAVWFKNHENEERFREMCALLPRLWARIDGTRTLQTQAGALSAQDRDALREFDILVPLDREFWLPKGAKWVDLAVILSDPDAPDGDGMGLSADFAAVH